MELAEQLKKEYQDLYQKQRIENLRYLREVIDNEHNQTTFAQKMGFTKVHLSNLEHGEKNLSLSNLLSYKKYFKITHSIDLSFDFLFGYTTVLENASIHFETETGLSRDAIKNFIELKQTEELNDIRIFMNELMGEPYFFNRLIWNIFLYVKSESLEPCVQDKDGNFISLPQDEIYYFLNDESSIAGGYMKLNSNLYEGLAQKQIIELLTEYKKIYNPKGD